MPSVDLKITRNETGKYYVVVNGTGFYEARNGKPVGIKIKGDDEWYDETLFRVQGDFPARVLPDGSFVASREVSGSALNEDWGQDELYAVVSVEGYPNVKSNVVKGSY